MEWFFSFDEGSAGWYTDMVKVAALSARANTTLRSRCIYDGRPSALTNWLQSEHVDVIFDEVPFKADLSAPDVLARNAGTVYTPRHASGAYLRTICARHAESDVFLYTDCDVMFMNDTISKLTTPTLSAVGEGASKASFNSGVLLVNKWFWLAHYDALIDFCRANCFFAPEGPSFDQILLNKFFRNHWSLLPDEMNWRPFDGINDAASIVHFHGPKPHRIKAILEGKSLSSEAASVPLLENNREAYDFFIAAFNDFLSPKTKHSTESNLAAGAID